MALSGEFELIERFFAPLAAGYRGALSLKDDAAIIDTSDGMDRVVTTDTVVEGVHFLSSDSPARVAQKALRVNLSDLAAMGAGPEAYTLSLHFSRDTPDSVVGELAQGFRADQERFGIHLAGGDTVSSDGPLILTITAIGRVERGRALQRSGAKAGDDIYVTGTIGDAGLGLKLLQQEQSGSLSGDHRQFLVNRYQTPEPRLTFGAALAGHANACLDVSDGLVADLGHIAAASGRAAEIVLEQIPVSPAALAVADSSPIERMTAGDDYELLFTAPATARSAIDKIASATGLPAHRIGTVREGSGVAIVDETGAAVEVATPGYRHR